MCWNEKVSWTTFVLGTLFNIFNILYFKNITMTLLSIAIEWLLLMQLFEALAWRDQQCGTLNRFATNGALIANLTQPIMLCMLFITFSSAAQELKLMSLAIAFGYICYVLYTLNKTDKYTCLRPSESCTHLDLYWWKNTSGIIYTITLLSIMLLLIRPMPLAVVVSGYIGFTLLASLLFYSCGAGSMWCWFTSMAPIVFGLYFKFAQI